MSGRKRAEVVEALEATVAMLNRTRTGLLDRARRLTGGQLDRAVRELAKARQLADAASAELAGADGAAEAPLAQAREMQLQMTIELGSAEKLLADARRALENCALHADAFSGELDRAVALEKQAAETMHANDGAFIENQWHREADFERARVAFAAAETVARQLEQLKLEIAAADARAAEAAEAVARTHINARLFQELTAGHIREVAARRIADDARRAELAGCLDALNALKNDLPDDYAAVCPPDAAGLPQEAAAAIAKLTADIALDAPAGTPETLDDLNRARRLAEQLGAALRESEVLREAEARRGRLAQAIMHTLNEMHFDISFEPGDRDRPFRIAGQTLREDDDGDFDIALPLDGQVNFEVADASGAGAGCHEAVTALARRLGEHFGVIWDTCDWGDAAGRTAGGGAVSVREGVRSREKDKERGR